MPDYTKEIVEAIKPILKSYSFTKKGLNWIFENEKIVKIFNIQKSQWGNQIFLNIGIIIKSLENEISHVITKCHIQSRLDDLLENKYLDFENKIHISKRINVLNELLISNPYNFFTMDESKTSLNNFIKKNKTSLVFENAKQYLKK